MTTLIKPVPVEPCGIKLLALLQRKDKTWYTREHQWGSVNHHFATVLNPIIEELADHGAIVVYTYGIRNNRLIRGSKNTSTHSNGLYRNGYKHWRDGSVGALGLDLRKVLFEVDGDRYRHSDILASLVVTDPGDLRNMITWLEKRGMKLYHKRINSVTPYHLHLQPTNLKGVL